MSYLEMALRVGEKMGSKRERHKPSEPVPATRSDGERWPEESLDAERRFGRPHAKLFAFIGKRVWTPKGAGVLLSVFADRCEVHPDGATENSEKPAVSKTIRVRPEEVNPIQ